MKITLDLDDDEVAKKVSPLFVRWLKNCIPVVEVKRGRAVVDVGDVEMNGPGLVIDVERLGDPDMCGLDQYETAAALLKALEAAANNVRKLLDEWPE